MLSIKSLSLFVVLIGTVHTMENTVNGKHLRIYVFPLPGAVEMKREQGNYKMIGILPPLVEWLSLRYNFTYSYMMDPNTKGILDQCLFEKKCVGFKDADIYLGGLIALSHRTQVMDFSAPFLEGPYAVLIPIPEPATNLAAIIQPFSPLVWTLLLVSFVSIIVILYMVSHASSKIDTQRSPSSNIHTGSGFNSFVCVFDYITKTLLTQDPYSPSKKLSIRLLLSTWGLFCFVMVQSYNNTLIAFVTSPNRKPVIKSVYDVFDVPGLKITVDKGLGFDTTIMHGESNFLKRLKTMLDLDPSLRCNKTGNCLEKVASGNHVYVHSLGNVVAEVVNDRKKTGKCRFAKSRENFYYNYYIVGLKKNSPYTNVISQGILESKAMGLMTMWSRKSYVSSYECFRSFRMKPVHPRLTLRNMSSAFFILGIGYFASLLCFIFERCCRCCVIT